MTESPLRSRLQVQDRAVMKSVPKPRYKPVEAIEAQIEALESDAMRLAPDSDEHRRIMQEISRLRVYAEMKRWLGSPAQPRTLQ